MEKNTNKCVCVCVCVCVYVYNWATYWAAEINATL